MKMAKIGKKDRQPDLHTYKLSGNHCFGGPREHRNDEKVFQNLLKDHCSKKTNHDINDVNALRDFLNW